MGGDNPAAFSTIRHDFPDPEFESGGAVVPPLFLEWLAGAWHSHPLRHLITRPGRAATNSSGQGLSRVGSRRAPEQSQILLVLGGDGTLLRPPPGPPRPRSAFPIPPSNRGKPRASSQLQDRGKCISGHCEHRFPWRGPLLLARRDASCLTSKFEPRRKNVIERGKAFGGMKQVVNKGGTPGTLIDLHSHHRCRFCLSLPRRRLNRRTRRRGSDRPTLFRRCGPLVHSRASSP